MFRSRRTCSPFLSVQDFCVLKTNCCAAAGMCCVLTLVLTDVIFAHSCQREEEELSVQTPVRHKTHTTFTVMEIKQRIINCNRNIFTDTYQSEDNKHLVSQIFHRLQNSTSSRPKINIFVWLRIRKTFSWRLKSEQYLTFCKKKDFILCGTWIHWVWLNDHWMVSGINCSSYQLSYFYFTSFVLSWKHQQWLI